MSMYFQPFSEIKFSDPFFDSLKQDYSEFSDWFARKAAQGHSAYVFYNDSGMIDGFLYLKREDEAVDDINPALPASPRLKVGTFKINAHGTRLGERFVKKIFDHAVENGLAEIYVTVFDKHDGLISLLQRYGFDDYGEKPSHNGVERVFLKRTSLEHPTPLQNYPMLDMRHGRCFLLAIHPEYHTRMLPDSILNNESFDVVKDISHSNSIHKVYLAAMRDITQFRPGDVLLMYRTSDQRGPARYRSVVTSAGVVEESKNIHEFSDYDEFRRYCNPYSVFDEDELKNLYATKRYPFIVRFSYNVAMKRRVTRGSLIDNYQIPENIYWGVVSLDAEVARSILLEGGVNESLIVN